MKVKSLSRVRLLATPWTAAYQAPPPMGFARQEYWSGVPLPSPKKGLKYPYKQDSVVIHLEPDIPECEVKWAFGIISVSKASGGDGILVEPFQILNNDAVKVLHSIWQQIWKTHQRPQDWKRSVFTTIQKKGNAKECSD